MTSLLCFMTTFAELKPRTSGSQRESVTSTVTPYPSPPSTAQDTPQSVERSPPIRTRTVMSQSSTYSLSGDRTPTSASSRQTYFPLPSEYQSQDLLAKSKSITHSKSLSQSSSHPQSLSQPPSGSLSYSNSGSPIRSSGPSFPQEKRALL